jgi:hypothetical protein
MIDGVEAIVLCRQDLALGRLAAPCGAACVTRCVTADVTP